MKKFTVILLRPDYLASDDAGGFGQDVYVAYVEAKHAKVAAAKAQREVFRVDTANEQDPGSPDDYAVVVVLPGLTAPALWGWML